MNIIERIIAKVENETEIPDFHDGDDLSYIHDLGSEDIIIKLSFLEVKELLAHRERLNVIINPPPVSYRDRREDK